MANYNQRIWEVIKEKVLEVIHEEIEKALAPSAQSDEGTTTEGTTTEG